jgi:cytochrome c oxidase subunit 2
MTSEDVLHSFYIPNFRVKQDVVPGRYTTLWFQATQTGTFHLFCAEYCGTKHSGMVGRVVVQTPAEYERWLHEGSSRLSTAAQGEALFRQLGCGGCHGPGASVRAPLLDGIYNKPVAIEVPGGGTKVITADDRYIHDAILNPELEVAAGYKPIMPTFKGRVTEEQVLLLRDYIRSLGTSNGGHNGAARENTIGMSGGSPRTPLASPGSQQRDPRTPLASPRNNG